MRIRAFDIRWRVERPDLPDVIEYDFALDSYVKNHQKSIGDPLRRFIHKTYLVSPVFFKYVVGNSKKVFRYVYSEGRQ